MRTATITFLILLIAHIAPDGLFAGDLPRVDIYTFDNGAKLIARHPKGVYYVGKDGKEKLVAEGKIYSFPTNSEKSFYEPTWISGDSYSSWLYSIKNNSGVMDIGGSFYSVTPDGSIAKLSTTKIAESTRLRNKHLFKGKEHN